MRPHEIYEIEHHYQSSNHLHQNQRCKEKYYPGAKKGKDARILRGVRLIAEREYYMDYENRETESGLSLLWCAWGEAFLFTSNGDQVRIRIDLLTTFLKGAGQL